MVTPGRFELPTCGLGNRCSIHLSYGATFRIIYLQTVTDLEVRVPMSWKWVENRTLKNKVHYKQGSSLKVERANEFDAECYSM